MTQMKQCYFNVWKEKSFLIKHEHTICFDDKQINNKSCEEAYDVISRSKICIYKHYYVV